MTPEEKERMIHIRIKNDVHKDLRKLAAEYDLTMQDIVSKAVENSIRNIEKIGLGMEMQMEEFEKHAIKLEEQMKDKLESLQVDLDQEKDSESYDDEFSSFQVSIMEKLESIDEKIEMLLREVSGIKKSTDESE